MGIAEPWIRGKGRIVEWKNKRRREKELEKINGALGGNKESQI
jgi:hypothetical protein